MWVLSCEDEKLLKGKIWLRPGSAHLLGRTSNKHTDTGERVRYIDDNSVSRKHLILSVANVKNGDSARIHTRSKITATDGSRSGSRIDGVSLKKESKTLEDKDVHMIQLGSLKSRFKLEWRPIVLSFKKSDSAKAKGVALTLKEEKARLEDADIKLSLEYIPGVTTHVVSTARNTPYGLQALLQGKWLVTDSFVDALADQCKRSGGDGASDPGSAPLEDDFEGQWPNEMEYTVPSGPKEPVPRPNEYLRPDPSRAGIFSNQIFLFLSQKQHDVLLSVITAGGGKAVICDYEPGQTTVDDVIRFVKQLLGKPNDRNFLLSQEPGHEGVVIVRISEKAGGRSEEFMSDLSVALNQRTIEQNELLDAILTKDVSKFRQPLRNSTQSARNTQMADAPAPSSSIARPPASAYNSTADPHAHNIVHLTDSPPADSQRSSRSQQQSASDMQPERRPYKRIPTRTNITFNDDFDPSQMVPDDSSDEDGQPSQAPRSQVTSRAEASQQQNLGTQRGTQKRPAPPDPEEEEVLAREALNDRLFPALASAKRRKTEALARGEKSYLDRSPEPQRPEASKTKDAEKEQSTTIKGKTAKGRSKQIPQDQLELRERMKAAREAEEEAYRKEEEDLQRAGEEVDFKNYKATVVEFEVPLRPRAEAAAQTRTQVLDDHPEWRGRPNYKAFRSNKNKATQRPAELETQPVVIALEEVPGKDHGLGDEYWLKKDKKKKGSQSQSESQSQHRQSGSAVPYANGTMRLDDAEDEDDELAFRRRLQKSREEDALADADAVDNSFDLTPSQTMRTSTQKKATGKRPAASAGLDLSAPAPPSKKPRQTTARRGRHRFMSPESEDEDEEDDPLAFKRKRR